MAKTKKPKSGFDVTGKSISDLIAYANKNIKNLTDTTLRRITTRLVSAGNKRLKRYTQSDIKSRTFERILEEGKFSVKGKSGDDLKREYLRVSNFLKKPINTVRGKRKQAKQFTTSLNKKLNERQASNDTMIPNRIFSVAQSSEVMYIYDRLKEIDPFIADKEFKYYVIEEIIIAQETKTTDEIIAEGQALIDRAYERMERDHQRYDRNAFKWFKGNK